MRSRKRERYRYRFSFWVTVIIDFIFTLKWPCFRPVVGQKLAGVYLGLLCLKVLLGFFAFWLAATLVGRSDRAKKFREKETHWLNVLTAIVLLVVLMAGFMKMDSASYPKKVKADTPAAVEK